MLMMLPFEAPTIFEGIHKSYFRMPRVVKDQRNKFENDDLFRQLSHETAVKYTGFKDRPMEERQMKFITNCQEGHTEVSVVQSGNQFTLMFNPTSNPAYNNEGCDFDKEVGKVHIKSGFILNGVCVLWRGWVDLNRLEGFGCLEFDEYRAYLEEAMLKQQIDKQRACNTQANIANNINPANNNSLQQSPLGRLSQPTNPLVGAPSGHHHHHHHLSMAGGAAQSGQQSLMGLSGADLMGPSLTGLSAPPPPGMGGPATSAASSQQAVGNGAVQPAVSLADTSAAAAAAHYGNAAIAAAAAAFHQAFGVGAPPSAAAHALHNLGAPGSAVSAAAMAAAAAVATGQPPPVPASLADAHGLAAAAAAAMYTNAGAGSVASLAASGKLGGGANGGSRQSPVNGPLSDHPHLHHHHHHHQHHQQQQQHLHNNNNNNHHHHPPPHRQPIKRPPPDEQTQLDDVDVVSDIQAHDLDFHPRRMFKTSPISTTPPQQHHHNHHHGHHNHHHHHHRATRRA